MAKRKFKKNNTETVELVVKRAKDEKLFTINYLEQLKKIFRKVKNKKWLE